MVRNGSVDVRAEAGPVQGAGQGSAIERWDGRRGVGNLNAWAAMGRAVTLARQFGIGAVAMGNTNHWMRGGSYGWQAAEHARVNASARTALRHRAEDISSTMALLMRARGLFTSKERLEGWLNDLIKPGEELEGTRGIVRAKLARVHRAVGITRVLEDSGERLRRVQVVIHTLAERLHGRLRASPQLRALAFREAVRLQPQLEVAQPVDCGGSRLQPIEGEVQCLSMRHRRQQVSDGFRRVPPAQHVSKRKVVA